MAELDLLSAEGYVEQRLGDRLLIRVASCEPPEHPLGPEYAEPYWGIFGCAHNADPGWVGLFATNDVYHSLSTIDEESQERTERLSICIGASWAAVAASCRKVTAAQERAVGVLPPHIYEYSVEELLRIRGMINAADPVIVATVLGMTYHWQHDEGGYRGPRLG